MHPNLKKVLAFGHDLAAAAAAFLLGLLLRHGAAINQIPAAHIFGNALLFTAACGIVFLLSGLYRGIWAYASVRDLGTIVRAVTLAVLIYLPIAFLATRLEDVPRTTPVIVWLILLALLCGSRMAYRLLREGRLLSLSSEDGIGKSPVLLYGAGDEAVLFIKALEANPHAPYRIVGLIAENEKRVGRELHGIKILGVLDQLPDIMAQCRARGQAPARLILTRAAPGGAGDSLLEMTAQQGLQLSRLPSLTDLRSADSVAAAEQPLAIEDLLGRAETVLEREAIRSLIAGKNILVTGGGGTIGGELCRQIAALAPARLTIIENSEFNLYTIEMELRERFPTLNLHACLGDVRDKVRLDEIFALEKPELVFHAAALKHVPIAEENVRETVLTNVLGTKQVIDCARANGALAAVLISTDKAVNPVSIMGATKRIAEIYAQLMDHERGLAATRCLAVRFGNVLGSTGSVVPRFRAQLAQGGPLTVTHKDMTRYFMTVREAVELVLQASAFAAARGADTDEERSAILVLDMGAPVRIVDLARQMIRLAGLRPDQDIQIAFTGLRPGEKMHEELIAVGEQPRRASVDGVNILNTPLCDAGQFIRDCAALIDSAAHGATDEALRDAVWNLVGAGDARKPEAAHRRAAAGAAV